MPTNSAMPSISLNPLYVSNGNESNDSTVSVSNVSEHKCEQLQRTVSPSSTLNPSVGLPLSSAGGHTLISNSAVPQTSSRSDFKCDAGITSFHHHHQKAACCRSEVGRKCYSLPNRYKWCGDQYSSPHVRPDDALQPFGSAASPTSPSNYSSVSHELFRTRLASMKMWFGQFNDVQRNRVLTDILDDCGSSQIHLLSTWLCGDGAVTVCNPSPACCTPPHLSNGGQAVTSRDNASNSNISINMGNISNSSSIGNNTANGYADTTTTSNNRDSNSSIDSCLERAANIPPGRCRLHHGCPPDCQDPLSRLPTHVAHYLLSYLDPQSLARAIQVSRVWRWVCSSPVLWQRLASLRQWRMSPDSHRAQLIRHTCEGTVNWKEVVVERWRVLRNWLGAHCHVRTFSGHTEGVTCVQFDQHRIVSASHDNTIKVWSMRTNSQWPVQTLVGHSGRVRCLHLSNNRLVSGAADATIKVWEVEETSAWSSITCRVTMVGHTDTVRCLQVCCGNVVVSGSYDNTVRVWSLPSGQCDRTLRGHEGHVLSLAVVEEDRIIVSGSADNTIKVWELDSGYCLRTLHGHSNAITSLSADTHGIISGSLDSTIRAWDTSTGHCRNTVNWITSEGHTGVVRCVAADEWRVVSASDDKTIKVWERSTLRRLVTLRNHTDGVTCVAFNEFLIVSGSYDKTVKLWDFSVC